MRSRVIRGFSIIELVVVLGIMAVITSIVLFGQTNFDRALILSDTAYTIGFSVRQAQTFGLSSQRRGIVQNSGYGVHFTSGTQSSYILFADLLPIAPGTTQGGLCPGHTVTSGLEAKPGNCIWDSATETVSTYTLNRGFKVTNFCGLDVGSVSRCAGVYLDSLDITYLRPNTQATIIGTHSGSLVALSSAIIYVLSPDGTQQRCVTVSKVGQIAVGTCP